MVGRLVHHQHVRRFQDQLAVQHAALLTARQHLDRLVHIVTAKQQAAQNATDDLIVRTRLRPLLHPVKQRDVFFEVSFVVLGKVARLRFFRPI